MLYCVQVNCFWRRKQQQQQKFPLLIGLPLHHHHPSSLSLSLSVMALGACNPPHWKTPQKEQNVQRKEHNWTRPKRSYIKDSSFPHPRSVFEPVYHLNKPLPTSLHLQRHCLAECRDRVHTSPHSTQPLGRSQVTVHERKAAVTA